MAHLKEISPTELTDQHLEWIAKVAAQDYHGKNVRRVLGQIADGTVIVHTIEGLEGVDGLVGTCVAGIGQERELWIEFLVGTGLMTQAQAIRKLLQEKARLAGAVRLSGATSRPGLAKMYQDAFGLRPVAQIFSEEV